MVVLQFGLIGEKRGRQAAGEAPIEVGTGYGTTRPARRRRTCHSVQVQEQLPLLDGSPVPRGGFDKA